MVFFEHKEKWLDAQVRELGRMKETMNVFFGSLGIVKE